MLKVFTPSRLTCAIATISLTSLASAAGLDRSGQPSDEFSNSGTLAYISAYHISPDISGVEENGKVIKSVADDYEGYGYGAKTDVNDKFSVGVFYDQPFGADVYFEGNNSLVSTTSDSVKATEARVSSDNFTGLLGVNLGENNNFKIYGGPVLQKVEGRLTVHGDRAVISALDNYDLRIAKSTDYGYMVGAAYLKPEIGLKAAVTYRSAIEHDINYSEAMPLVAKYGLPTNQAKVKTLEMPQSVNIDFQTGLNPTTLLTAKARWVPWGDFAIIPPLLDSNVKKLVKETKKIDIDRAPVLAYTDDSYMLELGLGKRLTPAFAVSGSIGWDSGAGNPVSPLGPTEGFYSVGLGAKYNVTPNWAVSAGAKYLMLGDAKGQLSATKRNLGTFEDNDAYLVGVKLSYQAK
ncbi:outer membrane protein transport protein [Psychrobacter pygoscelis]|uniref:outer membrane protein transport protein n=1 Tax=Psychrobacter pygoscelis TaxID=2488563 RepID=UPI00103D13DD|nr:outer membrane protein transport protein [Psychrobacter pygoscelis]